MPACCPPCPQMAEAPSRPKGLQRKIYPLHPYQGDQWALVRAEQIRQRQNAFLGPQRRVVTALNLSSYWPSQSHRRCCWTGRREKKRVQWATVGWPAHRGSSFWVTRWWRFGLFPTDGLSQTLGDQSSSQYTVPAIPEVGTKFSSGLCWCRSSGYMPALHQVSELNSLCAKSLFCRENCCCRSPCTPSCNRALLSAHNLRWRQ